MTEPATNPVPFHKRVGEIAAAAAVSFVVWKILQITIGRHVDSKFGSSPRR